MNILDRTANLCFNGDMTKTQTDQEYQASLTRPEYHRLVAARSENFRRLAKAYFDAKYPQRPAPTTDEDLLELFELDYCPCDGSDNHPLYNIDTRYAVIYNWSTVLRDSMCLCVDLEEVESFKTDTFTGEPYRLLVAFDLHEGVVL